MCALLTKQIDKEILYGDATVAIYQGFTSLDVVGHYMPDLASLGPLFDSYGFLVLDVTTCRVIGHRRMALVNREVNTWAGTLELGLPPAAFPVGWSLSTRLAPPERIRFFRFSKERFWSHLPALRTLASRSALLCFFVLGEKALKMHRSSVGNGRVRVSYLPTHGTSRLALSSVAPGQEPSYAHHPRTVERRCALADTSQVNAG